MHEGFSCACVYELKRNASSFKIVCSCFVVQAGVAKLDTSVSLSGYRIELKMFGFSEKLPVLAGRIARRMKAVTLSEVHFAVGTHPGQYVGTINFFSLSSTCSGLNP